MTDLSDDVEILELTSSYCNFSLCAVCLHKFTDNGYNLQGGWTQTTSLPLDISTRPMLIGWKQMTLVARNNGVQELHLDVEILLVSSIGRTDIMPEQAMRRYTGVDDGARMMYAHEHFRFSLGHTGVINWSDSV